MALQYSTTVRNAKLDAIETAIGTSAVLKIRTGSAPVNVAAADSGTVLSTVNLPSDWMAAASGGTKSKSGTWEDLSADDTGTAAHFRVYASDGTTAHMQGTVTATSGGGDRAGRHPHGDGRARRGVTDLRIRHGDGSGRYACLHGDDHAADCCSSRSAPDGLRRLRLLVRPPGPAKASDHTGLLR